MNFNREEYSEFIKSEKELNLMLALDENEEHAELILNMLKDHLENKKTTGDVLDYSIRENRIEIDAPRYNIFMLILHNGDVCYYTINKKLKQKGNYDRKMRFFSLIDNLNKYLG